VSTIETIARQARAELDSDINLQIVGNFVSQKVTELYARTKYKALRKLGELPLAGALGGITNPQGVSNPNGTVTVTVGSNIVVGDSLAATFFTNLLEGQFFRVFQLKTWYRIAKVDRPNIILENAFVSESSSQFAPAVAVPLSGYYITPRFYAAAPDARFFGTFVLDYLYKTLGFISPEDMQRIYPSRFLVGPYPWCVSEFQSQLAGTGQPKMLEFYPAPRANTLVHYTYWSAPPIIGFYDSIPVTLDDYIAKELAFIPMMRHEMMKLTREGKIEAAGLMRNEYRAQETKAQTLMDQAIRNDSGVDDVTFIMGTRGRRRAMDYDPISTAEADVWSRNG
jgi:hypothetical protein